MNKQYRLTITIGVLSFVVGILGLLIKNDLYDYFRLQPFLVLTFSIMLLLIGVAQILMIYVKGGFGNSTIESRLHREEIKMLRNEFIHRFDEMASIKGDENKIKKAIEDKVNEITDTTLLEKIESKYSENILKEKKNKELFEQFDEVKFRLERENSRLSRYGLINLMLGFITTFMAIFFLAYSLSDFNETSTNTTSFIYRFAPRLSLSILIELFSFFFLRMYKKILDDLKYLNNERTNIDLQLLALKTAIKTDDKESVSKILLSLSLTERNFILKKDETTTMTERVKIENEYDEKIWDKITSLINNKNQ